jgi:N-acetylmuramoyl-L-alanine amidase
MFNKILGFCSFLFLLNGCIYNNEPLPQIVYNPQSNSQIILPDIIKPERNDKDNYEDYTYWLPPASVEKKWTAIVIHHSATDKGNAAIFDKWHRESNHWEGVGYDFVIGNGTNSVDGQVEVTFRWREQIAGAHCGGTPGNWANKDGIGICLVGNFNLTTPTAKQMQSLLELVRFLQKRYGIPKSRIYGHKTTPGARVTDCPGKKFPMTKFKSMLNY